MGDHMELTKVVTSMDYRNAIVSPERIAFEAALNSPVSSTIVKVTPARSAIRRTKKNSKKKLSGKELKKDRSPPYTAEGEKIGLVEEECMRICVGNILDDQYGSKSYYMPKRKLSESGKGHTSYLDGIARANDIHTRLKRAQDSPQLSSHEKELARAWAYKEAAVVLKMYPMDSLALQLRVIILQEEESLDEILTSTVIGAYSFEEYHYLYRQCQHRIIKNKANTKTLTPTFLSARTDFLIELSHCILQARKLPPVSSMGTLVQLLQSEPHLDVPDFLSVRRAAPCLVQVFLAVTNTLIEPSLPIAIDGLEHTRQISSSLCSTLANFIPLLLAVDTETIIEDERNQAAFDLCQGIVHIFDGWHRQGGKGAKILISQDLIDDLTRLCEILDGLGKTNHFGRHYLERHRKDIACILMKATCLRHASLRCHCCDPLHNYADKYQRALPWNKECSSKSNIKPLPTKFDTATLLTQQKFPPHAVLASFNLSLARVHFLKRGHIDLLKNFFRAKSVIANDAYLKLHYCITMSSHTFYPSPIEIHSVHASLGRSGAIRTIIHGPSFFFQLQDTLNAREATLMVLAHLEHSQSIDTILLRDDKQMVISERLKVAIKKKIQMIKLINTAAKIANSFTAISLLFHFLGRPVPPRLLDWCLAKHNCEDRIYNISSLFVDSNDDETEPYEDNIEDVRNALYDRLIDQTTASLSIRMKSFCDFDKKCMTLGRKRKFPMIAENSYLGYRLVRFDRDDNIDFLAELYQQQIYENSTIENKRAASLVFFLDENQSVYHQMFDEVKAAEAAAIASKNALSRCFLAVTQKTILASDDHVKIHGGDIHGIVIGPSITGTGAISLEDNPSAIFEFAQLDLESQTTEWDILTESNVSSFSYAGYGIYNEATGFWRIKRSKLQYDLDEGFPYDLTLLNVLRAQLTERGNSLKIQHQCKLVSTAFKAIERLGYHEKLTYCYMPLVITPTTTHEIIRIERAARRITAELRCIHDEIRGHQSEIEALAKACGATNYSAELSSAPLTGLPLREALAIQLRLFRTEYEYRQSIFDTYVQELTSYIAITGKPSTEWIQKNERPGQDTHFQETAIAFEGYAQILPFPITVPCAIETLPFSVEHSFEFLSLTDTALSSVREQLCWWLNTWRDVKTCTVCYERMAARDFIADSTLCQHFRKTCRDCITHYLASAIKDSSMLRPDGLPCFQCNSFLGPSVIREKNILPPHDYDKVCRFIRAARIGNGIDKLWCPNSNCDTVIDAEKDQIKKNETDVLECPKCATLVCPKCRQIHHPESDCENEFKNANLRLADEVKYQVCPNCNTWVEKTAACDHISCICGTKFCYKCGRSGHGCLTTCSAPRRTVIDALGLGEK